MPIDFFFINIIFLQLIQKRNSKPNTQESQIFKLKQHSKLEENFQTVEYLFVKDSSLI